VNNVFETTTKYRKVILITFIALALISGLLMLGVSINYNMVDYLPQDTRSTEALSIMDDEFNEDLPNARLMLKDISLQETLEFKEEISIIPGILSVEWLDDVFGRNVLLNTPLEFLDPSITENYYIENTALLELTIDRGMESSAINTLREKLSDDDALAGQAVNTAESQDMAVSEVINALMILLPIILIILFLTTTSWIEPLFYLITIGIAVLINMGTNIFFGEISFVTQTVAPILQLAVSLDYAIFLMHSFNERRKTSEPKEAMVLALKNVLPTVAASAGTTIVGFSALIFMRFGIGSDLGVNLVKGVTLSFLSVILFLPALTLIGYRFIDKTMHRNFIPNFNKIGKGIVRVRVLFLIIAVIVVIPSTIARSELPFLYGTGEVAESGQIGEDLEKINEAFGTTNPVVLLVPKDTPGKESEFLDELLAIQHVNSAVSYVSSVGSEIPREFAPSEVVDRFYSENYTRIILYLGTPAEGEATFQVIEEILEIGERNYETTYLAGESASLYDMKNVVEADTRVVNLVAIAGIFLVLLLTFRSLTIPIFLILAIESAIGINLSFAYFTGSALSYIGYLIISTIQLGATVDYAILITRNYLNNRQMLSKKDAMSKTLSDNIVAILVSAGILSTSGFILAATSTNSMISELGTLLGRGTALSFIMVVFVLPALFILFDRLVAKTTMNHNFLPSKKRKNAED